MRNLTINRISAPANKPFKYKVLVEDRSVKKDAVIISGRKCRMLGTISDGETKTFEIHNDKCRVYVIANNFMRNVSNDFYTILPGHNEVTLSGKTTFNPLNFFAFMFNGLASNEMVRNRKRVKQAGTIILSLILAACIILGITIGAIINDFANKNGKKFTHENMTITLTKDFKKLEKGTKDFEAVTNNKFEFYFSDDTVAVFGNRETYDESPLLSAFTLKECADTLLHQLKLEDETELRAGPSYFYFDYEQTVNNKAVTYYVFVYLDTKGFWYFNFSCPTNLLEQKEAEIFKYADSVTFK